MPNFLTTYIKIHMSWYLLPNFVHNLFDLNFVRIFYTKCGPMHGCVQTILFRARSLCRFRKHNCTACGITFVFLAACKRMAFVIQLRRAASRIYLQRTCVETALYVQCTATIYLSSVHNIAVRV